MAETLVAVAAHADDVELNAGGTVAKWAAERGPVHIVMVTDNCSGSLIPEEGSEEDVRRLPPAQTRAIRHREQEAAAELIGADVHYLDYAQRHYWDGQREIRIGYDPTDSPDPREASRPQILTDYIDPERYRAVADLLVDVGPHGVITHGPLDVDPEHHAVCSLLWLAFRERHEDLEGVSLRFWSPGSSCMWGVMEPHYDHFQDISDYYQKKLELCACHASQMTSRRLDMVARRAEYYGARSGVAHAEPFKTARHWGNDDGP